MKVSSIGRSEGRRCVGSLTNACLYFKLYRQSYAIWEKFKTTAYSTIKLDSTLSIFFHLYIRTKLIPGSYCHVDRLVVVLRVM